MFGLWAHLLGLPPSSLPGDRGRNGPVRVQGSPEPIPHLPLSIAAPQTSTAKRQPPTMSEADVPERESSIQFHVPVSRPGSGSGSGRMPSAFNLGESTRPVAQLTCRRSELHSIACRSPRPGFCPFSAFGPLLNLHPSTSNILPPSITPTDLPGFRVHSSPSMCLAPAPAPGAAPEPSTFTLQCSALRPSTTSPKGTGQSSETRVRN
jgi:hypothetical protein